MIRCKPLLGTFVEISVESNQTKHEIEKAIYLAFSKIELVQTLMSFYSENSDISILNRRSHLAPVKVHQLTEQVLKIGQSIHLESQGLFDCGVGQILIQSGIRPNHLEIKEDVKGSLQDLDFLGNGWIISNRKICLDLGGIAKGFAVDLAVDCLKESGIKSGLVNAGGDLRVFGNVSKNIHVRNPKNPHELLQIGALTDGAIATSGNYFIQAESQSQTLHQTDISLSHFINPRDQQPLQTKQSFSVIADKCVFADALTKVFALSNDLMNPCFKLFSAIPVCHEAP